MAPLLDCMGAIASALSEPCAWHQALDELRAPFASDACALARYHLGRRQGEYLIRNRLRADLDDGAPLPLAPPWLERLRPGAVPGDAWLDRALTTREELLASDFYRDWLAPDRLAHLSCGIVWRAGDVVITLEHFRRQGRPPFGHRHLMIHDLFLPRLGQAFELCRLLHAGPDDPDVLARALRPMAAAVVVADGAGRVMAASEAAQRTVVVDAAGEGDALPVAVAGASPLLHDAVPAPPSRPIAARPCPASGWRSTSCRTAARSAPRSRPCPAAPPPGSGWCCSPPPPRRSAASAGSAA